MTMWARTRSVRQTVPIGEIGLLIDAFNGIGGDVPQVLARSGLSHIHKTILMHGDGEVPRASFTKLFEECLLAFHHHSCRRDGFQPLSAEAFRMMCLAMLACPNLRTAIKTAGSFQDIWLGGSGRLALTTKDGTARLIMNVNARRMQLSDMVLAIHSMAASARLFSWLIGEPIVIQRITLKSAAPVEWHGFSELLPIEPEAGQPHDAMEFPESYLARPITRKYDELPGLFPEFPFDLYETAERLSSLAERVRTVTRAAIMRGEPIPDMVKLARMFGLTQPTFRRRIAEEATSLSEIRSDCKRELATKWLSDSAASVKEIASRLQFSDVASFRRGFRGWTGKSPFEYRALLASRTH